MAYQLVTISSLSGKQTTYTLLSSDVVFGTIGTDRWANSTPPFTDTSRLSSARITLDEVAQYFYGSSQTQSMWVSANDSQLHPRKHDQKVGLGTTTPDYTLDVAGPVGINDYLYHNDDADTLMLFQDDRIDFSAGNKNMLILAGSWASPSVVFNELGEDIDFRIESDDNTHALFVQGSTGSVGIGTNSPGYTLDVAGTIQSSIGLRLAGHPVVGFTSFDGGYATRLGSTGSSTLNATQIYAGGNVQATFKGGSVGIGTTSPDSKLEIEGTKDASMLRLTDTAGGYFIDQYMGTGTSGDNRAFFDLANTGSGEFVFKDTSATTMFIGGSYHRVGIGTTSPDNKLHVDVGASGYVKLEYDAAGWSGLEFDEAGTTRAIFNWDDLNNRFDFYAGGSNASDIAMSIKEGGNVGIGTILPSEKLTVSGNIRLLDSDKTFISFYDSGVREYTIGQGTDNKFHISDGANLDQPILTVSGPDGDYIGIGTTTPGNILSIEKSHSGVNLTATGQGPNIRLRNPSSEDGAFASIDFYNNANYLTSRIGATFTDTSERNTELYFCTRANGGDLKEAARFDSSGNFGIGTTNPLHDLHTVGDGIWIASGNYTNASYDSGIRIKPLTTTQNANRYFDISQTNNGLEIQSRATSGGEAMSDRHLILQPEAGNVGIGTTDPGATLDVAGNIKLLGNSWIYTDGVINARSGGNTHAFNIQTSNTGTVNIGTAGADVNIGTSSSTVNVNGAMTIGSYIDFEGPSPYIQFANDDTLAYDDSANTFRFTIDSTAVATIGKSNSTAQFMVEANDGTALAVTNTPTQIYGGSTILINNTSNTTNSFAQLVLSNRSSSNGDIRLASISKGSNNSDFAIITDAGGGGVEALRIQHAGNVGIGNASPSSLSSAANNLVIGTGAGTRGLTVYGSTGNLFFADGTTGTSNAEGRVMYEHDVDTLSFWADHTRIINIDNTGGTVFGDWTVTGALNFTGSTVGIRIELVDEHDFVLIKSGSNMVHMGSDEDYSRGINIDHANDVVGMGMSVPSTSDNCKLHLYRSSNCALKIDTNNGYDSMVQFAEGGTVKWTIGNDGNDGDKFMISTAAEPDTGEVVTVTQAGHVGLGTNAPAANLEIQDNNSSQGVMLKVVTDDSSPWHASFLNKTWRSDKNHNYGLNLFQGTDGISRIQSSYSNPKALLLNYNGGYVGIGSSVQSPAAELDMGTGNILFANDSYGGIYFGAVHEDASAHNGSWSYIRQGANSSYLEIGSDSTINFYETDARSLAFTFDVNSKELGIGISNPGVALDVSGDIQCTGIMYAKGNYIMADSDGADVKIGYDTTYGSGYGAIWKGGEDYALLWSNTNTFLNARGAGHIYFREDNNTKMTLFNNGNLRVGTTETDPGYKLQVDGDIQANGGWVRTKGQRGWYGEDYGVGIYPVDSNWVGVYPSTKYFKAHYIYQDGPGGYVPSMNGTLTSGYLTRADASYRVTNSGLFQSGNQFSINTTTPRENLHIHQTDSAHNYMRFTNSTTGTGASDGSLFGISSAEETVIWNFENDHILFGTNNNTRGIIKNDGRWLLGSVVVSNDPGYTINCGGTLYTTSYIRSAGDITAFYSDARLKKNVTPISDALSKVNRITGVTYQPNQLALDLSAAESDDQRVGVLAHEVEEVLPEAVTSAPFDVNKDKDGIEASISGEDYKTVQYDKLVPLLIEAIKELTERVKELESR